ncbi:AbrB/MazE/SpoVT family DNA-binding domain-containing protein [Alicyclobacillus kakegawensis]|nr:AbrB/MazE/SpoVT family DNA-binding domain-containing protein [Alicyclobacillus kakegawensis]
MERIAQRKVDMLGRIVLPIDILRILDIRDGTPVEIWRENEAIVFSAT